LSPKAAEQQSIKGGKEPGAMPDSLLRLLEAFRLQVAEVAIASKPELAYDLLVFRAAVGAFVRFNVDTGVDISFRSHRPLMGDVKDTEAAKALEAFLDGLELSWLGEADEEGDIDLDFGDVDGRQFAAFQKLTPKQKANILAYCVATAMKPSLAPATGEESNSADLALTQTGTRVMDYWRPTVANYLGRITTAQLIKIGAEIVSEQWADRVKSECRSAVNAEKTS
jgi:ParB family transcriptional regulator, chromosome partitioning protein